MRQRLIPTLLGFVIMALLIPTAAMSQDRPKGYRQILPRGRIAAIDNPTYVPASEADIPDDAWVLGAVIEGKPFAYSITLLNSHEIVNDKVGDTAFAAVW